MKVFELRSRPTYSVWLYPRLFELPLRFPLNSSRMPDGDVRALSPQLFVVLHTVIQLWQSCGDYQPDVVWVESSGLAAADFMDIGEA